LLEAVEMSARLGRNRHAVAQGERQLLGVKTVNVNLKNGRPRGVETMGEVAEKEVDGTRP